jgi:hypothetical protein
MRTCLKRKEESDFIIIMKEYKIAIAQKKKGSEKSSIFGFQISRNHFLRGKPMQLLSSDNYTGLQVCAAATEFTLLYLMVKVKMNISLFLWVFHIFFFLLLLCWVVGVHCGIYKGSYHALNIRT